MGEELYLSRIRQLESEIEYLHGRMKPAEKDAVMERFARGEIDVLVSTTVVEVGVDVPNATLMVIENAESYGLAQLHQLRGRVGRGSVASECFLLTAGDFTPSKRLRELEKSNDGFHTICFRKVRSFHVKDLLRITTNQVDDFVFHLVGHGRGHIYLVDYGYDFQVMVDGHVEI